MQNKYFATESYHICDNRLYIDDEHEGFILYKACERGRLEEYKGWYLSIPSKSKYSPTCYEYYKVIKDILNGKVNGINQKIDEIRVVLPNDFVLNRTMTLDWSDEEILKELSKCFRQDYS